MIPFEEIQEQCIQNKEKVDKYSKIISISLFFIFLFLISYYEISFYNNEILSIAGFFSIFCLIFALSDDRIYSKLPAILGACLIVIANVIAIKDSFFSNGLTANILFVYAFNTFSLWVITFSIHCIIVYILGHTIFKNNKVKYTARIIKLEESKNKNSYTYYAYFYDYTNKKIFYKISEKEYKTWKEGDYIETILQPKIDYITVEKIKHLTKFKGKTDMEIFQERHKRDVELFGQSQEEMDDAKGEAKIRSYVIYFILSGFIDIFIFIWAVGTKYFDAIMSNDIIYALTTTVALAIPIYTSYKEYSMIKTKGNYTLEDLAIWKDFLVPRCLFYFIISFTFIGGLISILKFLFSFIN
jgi:hypothetical protein